MKLDKSFGRSSIPIILKEKTNIGLLEPYLTIDSLDPEDQINFSTIILLQYNIR